MTINHHPDIASLMSCAAGSQPEAIAAVVASHLAVCPACARQVNWLERIGEALFDTIEPVTVERTAPVAAARALEADEADPGTPLRVTGDIPLPLVGVAGTHLDKVPWKRVSPGVWQYPLPLSAKAKGNLRLIKVAPGRALPDHGHSGEEMTLVLRGSYTDVTGRFGPGDVADLDNEVEHAPITDAQEGCICLIASEKPARFKSLLARMMQPLSGM